MDYVFANAAALRAVRRFEESQEQVVPKHKLVVEIDLDMYTATQMVMVRQVKLEAPDQNKLEKDFGNSREGKRRHFLESCDKCAFDEAWETLLRCLQRCLLETAEREDRREDDGRKREGAEVCARAGMSETDTRIHGPSRRAEKDEEEADRPNQIDE